MKVFLTLLILFVCGSAFAQSTYVNPYTRRDGTYVEGHYRSLPNNSTWDNYSTKGNINPYTGDKGYKNPYPSPYNSYDYNRNNDYQKNNNY